MQNPTRDKFREAEHFLAQMNECFEQDDEFRFSLSAYVSAARSITFWMQKQYDHVPGFRQWYSERQTEMRADLELRYLKELRNKEVKTERTGLGATRQGTLTVHAVIASPAPVAEQPKVAPEAQEHTASGVRTVRRFLPKFHCMDVVSFCDTQLQKLETLLDECERLFLGT